MPTYFSRFQGSWKLVCICLWHIVYLTLYIVHVRLRRMMFDISQWDKIQRKAILGSSLWCEYLFQKYRIFMVILAFLNLKFFNCTSYFSGLLPFVYLCSLILRLCILGQIMWPVQLSQRIHMYQFGSYKENTYI